MDAYAAAASSEGTTLPTLAFAYSMNWSSVRFAGDTLVRFCCRDCRRFGVALGFSCTDLVQPRLYPNRLSMFCDGNSGGEDGKWPSGGKATEATLGVRASLDAVRGGGDLNEFRIGVEILSCLGLEGGHGGSRVVAVGALLWLFCPTNFFVSGGHSEWTMVD